MVHVQMLIPAYLTFPEEVEEAEEEVLDETLDATAEDEV